MTRILLAALCAAPLVLGAPLVQAKSISKILAESGLSPEDVQTMTGASVSLYKDNTPKAGASRGWKNTGTGSHGTVTVKSYDGKCVVLEHSYHPKGAEGAVPFVNKHCKNAEGAWGS